MADPIVYVIGAGLAGLACAVALADSGRRVRVLEAGPAAGGRCRSYHDAVLGCRIDNGNHLLLSGNRTAMAWLDRLGTRQTMTGPGAPVFPFIDLATGERWVLRPGKGRLPLWLFAQDRRVPGTSPADYLALLRWLRPPPGATVAEIPCPAMLRARLIDPLAIAALNTLPDIADASLMRPVLMQTLLAGGSACIPLFPREGLSESLVDPAVALLRDAGGDVVFGQRTHSLVAESGRVTAFMAGDRRLKLDEGDQIVLAVPAPVAATLLPRLVVPDAFESILNLHYATDADPGRAGFVGIVNGIAEWVFVRPGLVSVTVSAANRHTASNDEIAAMVWTEVCRTLDLPAGGALPPYRVLREKRATFAATAVQNARRPGVRDAGPRNVVLAGDWTRTGLPATIEGSLRSGQMAARAC